METFGKWCVDDLGKYTNSLLFDAHDIAKVKVAHEGWIAEVTLRICGDKEVYYLKGQDEPYTSALDYPPGLKDAIIAGRKEDYCCSLHNWFGVIYHVYNEDRREVWRDTHFLFDIAPGKLSKETVLDVLETEAGQAIKECMRSPKPPSRFEREWNGEFGDFWRVHAYEEAERLLKQAANIEVEADGAARWKSSGNYLPEDVCEILRVAGVTWFSPEATAERRAAQIERELDEYRKNQIPETEEELLEMRAAFGEGTEIVDVISGRRMRL